MAINEDKWDEQQKKIGASFLQSLPWAKFQQSLGNKYHLINGPGFSCMLLEKKTRLGKYLFAPYGPSLTSPEYLPTCLEEIKQLANQTGASWLRLEPLIANGRLDELLSALVASGAVRAAHNAEPPLTRILDLSPPADDLLAGISQSTRSIIRKNQRENSFTFKTSIDPKDMAIFIKMLHSVSGRKGVNFFSDDYFKVQAEQLMPEGMLFLELALYENKPLACLVMHDYGHYGSYTYAASLPEARDKSASALLLWQAMLNAKSRQIQKLDLYGIAPDDAHPSNPWYGFSSFKKKFGGQIVQRAGTWDVPLSSRYKLYRSAYKAHRLLRRR